MVLAQSKRYVDDYWMRRLRRWKQEGTLGQKRLTTDLWLNPQQAKELGFNQGEGDFELKSGITEGEYAKLPEPITTQPVITDRDRQAGIGKEMADIRMGRTRLRGQAAYDRLAELEQQLAGMPKPQPITTTPTMTTGAIDMLPVLQRLYPDRLQPLPSPDEDLLFQEYQRTGGQLDLPSWQLAGSPLRPEMEFDYLEDLTERASFPEAETILRGLGASEQDLDQILGIQKRQDELLVTINTIPALRGYTLESLATLMETDYNTFLAKIQSGRWTTEKQDLLKSMGYSDMEISQINPWKAPQLAPEKAERVTFWENPALWWQQYQEKYQAGQSLDQQAAAIRQETLANTPGIIGLVNRPMWRGGLSAEDVVGIGLLAYGGYQAARIGWDFFLRSSLLRNLNSWAKSANIEIPNETKNSFINQAMANLSKKYLSQQAIKTIFKPTKAGLQATPEVVKQAETEILALVKSEAPVLIPRATQTGALAFGGEAAKPDMIGLIVGKIRGGVPLAPEEEQFRVNNRQAIEDALKAKAPEVTPTKPAVVAPIPIEGAVVAPEKVTPAPEVIKLPPGLKKPLESLSTEELERRLKLATPYKKLYQTELDRRVAIPKAEAGMPEAVGATILPKDLAVMKHKDFITELKRQGKPLLIDDLNALVNKMADVKKGFTPTIEPGQRPVLVFRAIEKGVMTDGFVLVESKEATREVVGKFLEKEKTKEVRKVIKLGWEEAKAKEEIEKQFAVRAEEGTFPNYQLLYPKELGKEEVKLVGVHAGDIVELIAYVSDGTTIMPVDADRLAFVLKYLPDAKMFFSATAPRNSPLVFQVKGENKGLLMPMSAVVPAIISDKVMGIAPKVIRFRAPIIPEVKVPAEPIITKPEVPAVAEAAPLPLLSVPEETTLPMPDEVKASEDRVVLPPPPPKEPPPTEPLLTHPPQPAPIEAGRITMPDLQPPQQVVDLYSKPDFWRRVGNLPIVKKAVGAFDPAAIANDPPSQTIILRAVLKDEGAQKAQAVMSHLWEIGTQERVWGKTDEIGLLTSEPFVGISVDDIRQNPSKFSTQMTPQQKEWIKRASEIEKVKLDALKRNGIEINELSFEDGGEYAGRRVMGKFNDAGELIESGRIGVGGRVGAKQAFEKTRVFKEAADGITAGYRYMNSDEALYYNTLGAYFKIADKQMAEWLLTKIDWRTTKAPEALVLQAEAARLRLRKAQQLAAALNRAVRGERVPSSTINSIATAYADQADTLRTLIPELQKPAPETADTVQILDREAKALISEARLEYAQAVNKRARAREEAMRVKYEEASIAHPAFAGKIFTGAEAKEIADILRRGLTPQFIEALGAVNKVNAIGRFFMLAGDASPMAIQLQFLAFYRPVAYGKAMGGFVRAMFDPEFQYRQYANNRDLINRHPTLILSGRGTEFTEFMGRGGLGKKLGVLAKPLVPFQKAFEGALDTAGIELAKSLDHLSTTPERTLEVDQFINEFRGITSSARIGVSSTQRQAETAVLLAPRYNRAIAAYLFDIVHGGLRGELARMSLAQGLAGLSAMAVAVSIALGEDDDEIWQHFDPRSPKFFTWDVMGVKIGLGGKVRSVIKTFGNMSRTGEVGQPALNFLRGNLSPGASTGLDLITGKNYIGEPTRDNVLDFTKTVGRNFMMIWTQAFLMEGGTLQDKAIIATAEFFGLRGYDISAKKELKIKDLEDRLGEVVGKIPVLTKKKPDIYDTRNIFSDVKRILKNMPPEDVLADKGFAGWGHLVVRIQQSEANTLPNIAFKDYNFDKAKGDTLADYMSQWAERQQIEEAGERATYVRVKIVEGKEERTTFKGLEALAAHKVDYPNAQRGNLTRRQRELLLEFNAAVDKKQFIKDHPEMKVSLRTDWLKSHPEGNAELALVGQAPILTKEAYNAFKSLLKNMDIVDAGIPEQTLPPEGSIDNYFKYQDMDNKNSWEAQLMMAQDDDLRDFLGRQPIDTPIASLELRVKNRANFDKLEGFANEDSPDYIADEKKRVEEVKKFKATNLEFVDDIRRIEAIEKGSDKIPTPETIIKSHVDYGKLIDQEGIGSSSAEANLAKIDQTGDVPKINAYGQWRIGNGFDKEAPDLAKVPIWNIDVKYHKEDAEYDALPATGTDRADYLAKNEAYRKDRRRREAYQKDFPSQLVEPFVQFWELPIVGYRQERMLIETPGLAEVMGRKVPERVPSEQWDILNEKTDRTPEDDLRMDAYKLYVPDGMVEDYVGYKTLPEGTYEDDWFLQEHPEFYKEVYLGILGNKRKDYRKVPTRRVYAKYLIYDGLTNQYSRDQYRLDNPDLDEWGVLTGIWSKTMSEQRQRLSLSPSEKLAEEVAERLERIKKLREPLPAR